MIFTKITRYGWGLSAALLLLACGDDASSQGDAGSADAMEQADAASPDATPVDLPPQLLVNFPPPYSRTGAASVRLHADATDDQPGLTATLNGTPLSLSSAQLSEVLSLDYGENTFVLELKDSSGQTAAHSFALRREEEIENPFTIQLDAANDALYYVDTVQASLTRVTLSSGRRQIVSDNQIPDAVNSFGTAANGTPAGLALDIANNRALVSNRIPAALYWVDLTTGARTVLSDATTPNATNVLNRPARVEIDAANSRALVLDKPSNSIVAVDLGTGARTILSSSTVPNANAPVLTDATDLVVDVAGSRLLVSERTGDLLVAIDLTTGVRSILSDNSSPVGGASFDELIGLGLDAAKSRALTFNRGSRAIIAVDLDTGTRTLVSSDAVPNATLPMVDLRHLAVDASNSRILIADNAFERVVAVDDTSGARTLVSDNRFPDASAAFTPVSIVQEASSGDLLYNSYASVHRLDWQSMVSTEVSSDLLPDNTTPFGSMTDMVMDGTRLLTLQQSTPYLIAADIATGARSLISSSAVPNGDNLLSSFSSALVHEAANNRVLVLDYSGRRIMAVSLVDGARTPVSDSTIPDAVMPFIAPVHINRDPVNGGYLVADEGYDHLLAVNATTGARTAFPGVDALGGAPTALSLSPDEASVVVAVDFRQIVSVDLASGVITEIVPVANNIPAVRHLLHLGKYLVAISNNSILVLSMEDGQYVVAMKAIDEST